MNDKQLRLKLLESAGDVRTEKEALDGRSDAKDFVQFHEGTNLGHVLGPKMGDGNTRRSVLKWKNNADFRLASVNSGVSVLH